MTSWNFKLPQLAAEIFSSAGQERKLFAVAGGRSPDKEWLCRAAGHKEIYCADKGAEYCLSAGIVPKKLYGDADSASKSIYAEVAAKGTEVHCVDPEKNDTDLQLLLKNLPAANVVFTGVWGGRFDHLYSNVFSLLAYKKRRHAQVAMADEKETMFLLTAGETINIELRDLGKIEALSLIPLSDAEVDLFGVFWPLNKAKLEMLYPYAISNIPQEKVSCTCHEGAIGLYLCFVK
ncbi:MAG: thiamine diphosphokinase [Phascolarctobacterium sp.]|nr:thiamine diphosphokinase [Phascolarctobacterium sp.]